MSSSIQSIDFWHSRRDLGTATTVDKTFFAGAGTLASGEYSDLTSDGCLPENRQGDLTGLFIQQSPDASIALATYTNALRLSDANTFYEMLLKCQVILSVNGVAIARGACLQFGNNAPYWHGSAATSNPAGYANVGVMSFLSHTLFPNNLISVRIKSRAALAVAMAATGLASMVDVAIQTQTSRLVS